MKVLISLSVLSDLHFLTFEKYTLNIYMLKV